MKNKSKRTKVWCDKQQKLITRFEHKWGISAPELAKIEGVTPDAIHMRVHRFGSPFIRRGKESFWEKIYGKTITEIAEELDIHPVTVAHRHRRYGSPYITPERTMTDRKTGEAVYPGEWNLGQKIGDTPWKENPKWKKPSQTTTFTLDDIT